MHQRLPGQHRCVEVPFDDAAAFFNANTPEEFAKIVEDDVKRWARVVKAANIPQQ